MNGQERKAARTLTLPERQKRCRVGLVGGEAATWASMSGIQGLESLVGSESGEPEAVGSVCGGSVESVRAAVTSLRAVTDTQGQNTLSCCSSTFRHSG